MYFLVVSINIQTGGIGHTSHGAKHQRDGAGRGNVLRFYAGVQVPKYDVDAIFERLGRMNEAEEGARAVGGKVAELKTKERFALGLYGL